MKIVEEKHFYSVVCGWMDDGKQSVNREFVALVLYNKRRLANEHV